MASAALTSARALPAATSAAAGPERAARALAPSRVPAALPRRRVVALAAAKDVDISKVTPAGERVLVEVEKADDKTVGGVLLPTSAVDKRGLLCGKVLSVGAEPPPGVSPGASVLFSKWTGQEVEVAGKKAVFVKHNEILAIVS